ncbi:MAG: hypothetical protein ACRD8U_05760, partial [Pyrinomonadaceae bacterium]
YTKSKRAVRQWLLRILQPCRQMVPLMAESMDRRLGVSEYLKLRLHLLVCAWCTRYLKQIKIIRHIMRLQSPMDPSAGESEMSLAPEALQRIAKALNR